MDHILSCDQGHPIEIDYLIGSSEVMNQEDTLDLHYMVYTTFIAVI